MSGKRQHFVPRFLQEGFASRKTKTATFAWVYRKGHPPLEMNTINIGVEGFFYTNGADSEADDILTEVEGPFNELISGLRELRPGPVSDTRIPDLIGHLEFRTRHLRQTVLKPSAYFMRRLLDYVEQQDMFLMRVGQKLRNEPHHKKNLLMKMMKRGVPQSEFGKYMRAFDALIPAALDASRPALEYMVASMRPRLEKELSEMIKSAHIKALKMPAEASEGRIQRYKGLSYRVEESRDLPLILGDSTILFVAEKPKKPYRTLLQKDDILSAVLLPISAERLLIGSKDGPVSFPTSELRQAIARCSVEFFISDRESESLKQLSVEIGRDAELISEEELEQIVERALSGQG